MKTIFSATRGKHDRLDVIDYGPVISFSWLSCFDYAVGEWESSSVAISKKNFSVGINRLVSDQRCAMKSKDGMVSMRLKSTTVFVEVADARLSFQVDVDRGSFLKAISPYQQGEERR